MGERVFSVDTQGRLMLRRQADGDSAVLARLAPGQVVARLDEEDRDGWYWVFADVPGQGAFVGYVAGRFLASRSPAAPMAPVAPEPSVAPIPPPVAAAPVPGLRDNGAASPFVRRLIAACEDELAFFNNGRLKEGVEPALSRIGEYWRALNEPSRNGGSDVAWSAAFISFMMRKAGAGRRFSYSGGHAIYINRALRDRDDPNAPFQAFRPEHYAPQLGDLIARARPTNTSPAVATYDNALSLDWYTSHTDIVTAVGDGWIETIGGNLSNSVRRDRLSVGADGRLSASFCAQQKIFAVMRNGIADPV